MHVYGDAQQRIEKIYLIKVINVEITRVIDVPKHKSQKPITPTIFLFVLLIIIVICSIKHLKLQKFTFPKKEEPYLNKRRELYLQSWSVTYPLFPLRITLIYEQTLKASINR